MTYLSSRVGKQSGKEYPVGKEIHTHNKQKTPSGSPSCQTLPHALTVESECWPGKLSFTSASGFSGGAGRPCWRWGRLVADCGEKVLYTYDTCYNTQSRLYFAKRLIFLATHPPEEHKARPPQQAFLNKCKTRAVHTDTRWGICRDTDVRLITLRRPGEGVAAVCPSEDQRAFTGSSSR